MITTISSLLQDGGKKLSKSIKGYKIHKIALICNMHVTAALENKCVLHIQYRQTITETINTEKRTCYPQIHNATLRNVSNRFTVVELYHFFQKIIVIAVGTTRKFIS